MSNDYEYMCQYFGLGKDFAWYLTDLQGRWCQCDLVSHIQWYPHNRNNINV